MTKDERNTAIEPDCLNVFNTGLLMSGIEHVTQAAKFKNPSDLVRVLREIGPKEGRVF